MEEKKEYMKGRFIRPLIIVASIVILFTAIRLTLKSDWLLEYLRPIAEDQLSAQLNGSVSLQQLKGDLLSGLTVINADVSDQTGNTLIHADTIHVGYHIFSLIGSPKIIDGIVISGLDIQANQQNNESWNLLNILPEAETEEPDSEPLYWFVDFLRLKNSGLTARSEMLPDGRIEIEKFELVASAGFIETGWLAVVDDLRLNILQKRLNDPVELQVKGSGDEKIINLEQLLFATGRSLLTASGRYEADSEVNARAEAKPLSWEDLDLFTEELPLQQDVNISLTISGQLPKLNFEIEAGAPYLESMVIKGGFNAGKEPVLNRLQINAGNINGSLFSGLDDLPEIKEVDYSGSGFISFDKPEDSDWTSNLKINQIKQNEVTIDRLSSVLNLKDRQLLAESEMVREDQSVRMEFIADQIFSEMPEWSATVSADEITPSSWMSGLETDALLNARMKANGTAFTLSDQPIDINFELFDSIVNGQPFAEAAIEGRLSENQMNGILTGRIDRSSISAEIEISNWQEVPSYVYSVSVSELNFTEIEGFSDFKTYINAAAEGEGESFDIEKMNLQMSAHMDSSNVNGEPVDTLYLNASLNNGILDIDEIILESPIADGIFRVRQDLFNLQDPDNELDLNLEIKNPQPLAPLFNAEIVSGTGTFTGKLTIVENGVSQLNSNLELADFRLDSLLTVERMENSARVILYEDPDVQINLSMSEPVFNGFLIQDFELDTNFLISDSLISGAISADLINDTESSLHQGGTFRIQGSDVELINDQLRFETPLRTLSLQEEFRVQWTDKLLSTNMFFLQTEDEDEDAFVKFEIAGIDSLNQELNLEASQLNLGVLQRTLTNQSMADGFFSGMFSLKNTPDSLNLVASGKIRNFEMNEGKMDSIAVEATVQDEWLNGSVGGWNGQETVLQGAIRVPYLPGDPLTFDEQFFDRNIDGRFQVNPTKLSYFLSFLEDVSYEQTDGMFSFEGLVSGTAGNPEFTGSILTTDGAVSGIPLDSLDVELTYLHESNAIDFEGHIVSLKTEILNFDTRLPLSVDLKKFELILPEEGDSLRVQLRTNDFDLALTNNFLPRENIRRARGRLNGDVSILGTIGNMQTDGKLAISGASVSLVPVGITLEDIRGNLNFQNERIELEELSIKSGPGRFNASGFVELDNLSPGNISAEIEANQFMVANTQQMRAIINLSTQIDGTAEAPGLTGSLQFLNGFYELQNFGERAIEDVQLEGEEEPMEFAFYDSLSIEMEVLFDRQFFIRNEQFLDMEVELAGQVDLLKKRNQDIQMFGTIEGVSGFARPLGKNFTIDEATVAFSGPVENPQLNIRTAFKPPEPQADVTIFYIIEGSAQDPEFRFESEPEMELQNILSYALFGQPFYALEPWQQSASSSGTSGIASDLAFEFIMDRVENLATQQLGIDVVQIDNTRSGSNSTTSIKTGWYINRRTFFALLNEIDSSTPKTLFILEYMLKENLELILTQGDDSRQGVDLRWKRDY